MTMQAVPPTAPVGGAEGTDGRSLGELVVDLRDDLKLLAKQEVELAKAELAEKAKHAAIGAGLIVGAVVVGSFTFTALTILLIVLLDLVMPLWASALIVTVLYVATAITLLKVGMKRFGRVGSPLPTMTMRRIKEDLTWLKRRAL